MILVLNCGSQSIKWKLFKDSLKLKEEGKRDVFNSGNYRKILAKELEKVSEDDRYYALSMRLKDNLKYFLKCVKH